MQAENAAFKRAQPLSSIMVYACAPASPGHCGVCLLHLQLPSTDEIEALFMARKLNTIVFFLDETFEELAFDVTTTVLEAVEQLAAIIKLQV